MTSLFRRSLILAGLAILAISAIAYAHGPGYGHGYGNHMSGYGNHMGGYGPGSHMGYGPHAAVDQLAPEQREAYEALTDSHVERMNALHDQAVVLENQLRAAQDTETASRIRESLTDTANRMDEEMANFSAQAQERFGVTGFGHGPGYASCPGWNNAW